MMKVLSLGGTVEDDQSLANLFITENWDRGHVEDRVLVVSSLYIRVCFEATGWIDPRMYALNETVPSSPRQPKITKQSKTKRDNGGLSQEEAEKLLRYVKENHTETTPPTLDLFKQFCKDEGFTHRNARRYHTQFFMLQNADAGKPQNGDVQVPENSSQSVLTSTTSSSTVVDLPKQATTTKELPADLVAMKQEYSKKQIFNYMCEVMGLPIV